jgi:hypothetical protein
LGIPTEDLQSIASILELCTETQLRDTLSMDVTTMTVLLRFTERMLIVAGAIVCVILGYRLLMRGVVGESNVEFQENKVKFRLMKASPGIIFSLFGMMVLGIGTFRQVSIKDTTEAKPVNGAEVVQKLNEILARQDVMRERIEFTGMLLQEGSNAKASRHITPGEKP